MQEFVQAHASYRFIVLDEEDERPRILVSDQLPYLRTHSIFSLLDVVVQA